MQHLKVVAVVVMVAVLVSSTHAIARRPRMTNKQMAEYLQDPSIDVNCIMECLAGAVFCKGCMSEIKECLDGPCKSDTFTCVVCLTKAAEACEGCYGVLRDCYHDCMKPKTTPSPA